MAYADDLNLPQFSSDLACEAAGIDAATLKKWISRKPPAVFLLRNERRKVGNRTFLSFSLRRVLQIAIIAELVDIGLSPMDAAFSAAAFTDSEDSIHGRRPGALFSQDNTLLLIRSKVDAEVVNESSALSWRQILRSKSGSPPAPPKGVLLDLNSIDRRVRTVLGLPLTARPGAR
jgi:hypothetical protein